MLEKLLAKRHIGQLDLRSVRNKLIEIKQWNPEQAERVELDYRRFLFALVHRTADEKVSPPTNEVDEFWHQHILDTRKYREDCKRIFGHYIDHTPGLAEQEQARADLRRRRIYSEQGIDSMVFDSGDGDASGFFDSGHHGPGSHHSGSHGSDSGGHDGGGHSGGDGGGDGGGGHGGGGCSGDGGCGGGGCGGS
jgi:hypothetical protein